MSRRRLILFGVPVVVVLGVGAWVFWVQPRTAITRENAAKIEVGMTLAEVEAILGGPARFEFPGPLTSDVGFRRSNDELVAQHNFSQPFPANTVTKLRWNSETVTIDVPFDGEDRALQIRYILHRPESETFLRRVRRWLGL